MVVIAPSNPKSWISGMRFPRFGHHSGDRPVPLHPLRHREDSGGINPRHMGILAFEAGRTMSRLVSLHRALSDGEVARVRSVMRSQGVAYLNSTDQGALLRLACAEMVDDLDAAAAAVARLAGRCRIGVWPHRFDHFYADLKEGVADVFRFGLGSQTKDVEKKVKKMDKYVASTSALYAAMEDLADMEAREQRFSGRWKQSQVDGFDELHKHVIQQRERVRQLRNESLWGRDLDRVAELMARSVVSIFVRVCSVYGTFVADLPRAVPGRHGRVELVSRHHSRLHPQHQNAHGGAYSSGPLERPPPANGGGLLVRNSGPVLRFPAKDSAAGTEVKPWKEKALKNAPNTLGALGLELLYAKVVALVEKLATSSSKAVPGETREELYWMLPAGLRGAVSGKLRGHARMDDDGGQPEELAGGWKEAVEEILAWLAPMAHDTVRWHAERSFEQRQLDPAPRVLVLQTLAFSDKEKAEAAIVELLVAFSCVCRYRHGVEDDRRE
ncbi:hypothetical protein Taro_011699 [Colocasia esculenta]|uniref:Uncharacterized protein n=1 Tax=Colocasia esculenta TaxID=4460 RepID=A0A843U235_COLES|nr:hypothetical protein [Colocasia esculenta]